MRKLSLLVLLVLGLLLVSCGPAMKPAASTAVNGGEVFTVALPRIVIDFDRAGKPSILGLDMPTLSTITGFDLSKQRLNPFYVDWMTAANIQHVEIRQAGSGVVALVNGKPMPYLSWSDESLQSTGELIGLLPVKNTDVFQKLMPVVRRLGLDVVLRFPRQEGAGEIALSDPDLVLNLKPVVSGQPATSVIHFEIKYDQNGKPALLGITPGELQRLNINMATTELSPDMIQFLQSDNIQTIELRGQEDGLYVFVNGDPLPNIAWDDSILNNATQIYTQINDPNRKEVQFVSKLLPLVNKSDVAVLVHFPVQPGQAVLPARMHLD